MNNAPFGSGLIKSVIFHMANGRAVFLACQGIFFTQILMGYSTFYHIN